MSRIGFKPISIEKDVKVEIKDKLVNVIGPKGNLKHHVPKNINVKIKDNEILVEREIENRDTKSLHGLTRSLISNMVDGVSKGYEKKLEIVGVGYRAQIKNDLLTLAVGYSHPVHFMLPEGVKASVEGNNKIKLESCDKQLVGEVAAQIRKIRLPEPYKGKGIKYFDETIKKKAGKAAAGR